MDSLTIKEDSGEIFCQGTNEQAMKIQYSSNKSKHQGGDAYQKPGYRPNIFGGQSFSMDDFCKDTGIPFESMVRTAIKE